MPHGWALVLMGRLFEKNRRMGAGAPPMPPPPLWKTLLVDTKSSGGDIPLRNLKGNKMFPHVLWIKNSDFPNPLKLAEIIPIHKKEDPVYKDNYRSISILPLISKVFKRII